MLFEFTHKGWDDFSYWLEHDMALALKIKTLLHDIQKGPFRGIGKPEPLKFQLKGLWSRRITHEHRLIYRIEGQKGKD